MTKRVKVKLNIKPQAIICDIDGTVALMHGNRTPFEWDKVGTDKPNDWVIELLIAYYQQNPCKIIFLSGRCDECMQETAHWLYDNIGSRMYSAGAWDGEYELHMRPKEQEFEKDAKIKFEIYNERIKPYYDVRFVIDDRKQVVDMWRNVAGLPVAQVAEGNF